MRGLKAKTTLVGGGKARGGLRGELEDLEAETTGLSLQQTTGGFVGVGESSGGGQRGTASSLKLVLSRPLLISPVGK